MNPGVLLILFLFCFSARAEVDPSGKIIGCDPGFGEVAGIVERRSPERLVADLVNGTEELARTGTIKMKDLFPRSQMIPGGTFAGELPVIGKSEVTRFKRAFSDYTSALAKVNPDFERNQTEFLHWLSKKPKSSGPFPELKVTVVEAARKQDKTLADFFSNSYVEFLEDQKYQETLLDWAKRSASRPVVEHYKALRSTSIGRIFGPGGKAIVLGAGFSVGYGVLNAVSVGVTDYARRQFFVDDKVIKDTAAHIAENLTNYVATSFEGGKIKYEESRLALVSTVTSIQDLEFKPDADRELSSATLENVQFTASAQLKKFSKILDLNDKDRQKKTAEILKNMTSAMRDAEDNYTKRRAEREDLKERIAGRGTPPTGQERKYLEDLAESMQDSENDIAEQLASWRVYQMSIPDEKSIADINKIYGRVYTNFMLFKNIDVYRRALARELTVYTTKLESIAK